MLSRRQLIKTGLCGSALLLVAGYLAAPQPEPASRAQPAWRQLRPDDARLIAAIAPVMLGVPQLPLAEVLGGVDQALAGLPPAVRQEVFQLFDLLANRWGRRYLAGVAAAWTNADAASIAGFLQRWRNSRWQLLRSGYQGLHDLINAAWYGNPASWRALGYRQPATVMEMLP